MEKSDALVGIERLIRTIAEREGFKDFEIKSKTISSNGANYMGDLYLVDIIEDGKKALELFVKAANTSEQARTIVPANEVYNTEVFMYTTVAKIFEDLQKKYSVPEEGKFKFPRYYDSNLKEMEEVIVLENLAVKGFELFDRLKPIDWDYAKAAVKEIAKFHALSFALEKENYELFENTLKKRRNIFETTREAMVESMQSNIALSLSVVEPENHGRLKKFIETNRDKMFSSLMEPPKHPVLVHGDYRMSNIMVKYKDSRVVSLKAIDYQNVGMGCPIADLLYFLFTGSDENFRQQHYEDFFMHYHDTLASQLKLLSHDINDIYPRSEFYFDLKDKLILGLETGLFMTSLILIDPSEVFTIDDMLNGKMTTSTDIIKPNDAYAQRINGIVRDYVRWGFFKDNDNANLKIESAAINEQEPFITTPNATSTNGKEIFASPYTYPI